MSKVKFCDHTDPNPEVENKIDPDDGNSWACDACRLPIFSTPFITTVDLNDHNNHRVMHDQCAHDLPPKLEGLHLLHLREGLILHKDSTANDNKSCSRCHSMCGSKFYKCGSNDNCGFQLDLACALSIKIVHRSHRHRLTAIKGKSLLSSFICAICGTQHQPGLGEWGLRAYVCSVCDFWIHPDCALLPNAIVIDNKYHPHPLLLTYLDSRVYSSSRNCKICDHEFDIFDLRLYACFDCRYVAHIKCAVYSDHISFRPVLIRDAHIPNLLQLPMPNENTSVMSRMLMKNANVSDHASTSTSIESIDDHQMISKIIDKIHKHPLILHDHPADDVAARVCNACVQLISASDPFYSCSLNNNNNELASPCKDFFLHRCCAHLPGTLIRPIYKSLAFTLVSKAHTPFNIFRCESCQRRCNGFAYDWWNMYTDVVCAFMPTSIMHDLHAKSHILRLDIYGRTTCCCEEIYLEQLGYECNNCRDFNLHAKCALLPETVTHKFDRHPIKLITTQTLAFAIEEKEEVIMFCEICEEDIDRRRWYYGCKECDQYFHTGCIPTLDELSRIKFGFTVRVSCHDCPVTAVQALSVDGYPCDLCRKIIRGSDGIAFECSECYFRIHEECAKELLVSVHEEEDGNGDEVDDRSENEDENEDEEEGEEDEEEYDD